MNVIFEFTQIGVNVKVCAIDEATGIEGTVICPSTLSKNDMQISAMNKLRYLLKKRKNQNSEGGEYT